MSASGNMFPAFAISNLLNSHRRHFSEPGQSRCQNSDTKQVFDLYYLFSGQFCIPSLFASWLSAILTSILRVLFGVALIEVVRVNTPSVIACMQNHPGRKVTMVKAERCAMGGDNLISDRNFAIALSTNDASPSPTFPCITVDVWLEAFPQNLFRYVQGLMSQTALIAGFAQLIRFDGKGPTTSGFRACCHAVILSQQEAV